MNRRDFRQVVLTLLGVTVLTLTGCAGSEAPNPGTTSIQVSGPGVPETSLSEPEPEPVAEPETAGPDQAVRVDDPGTTQQGAAEGSVRQGAPCEVTGYTPEGREERIEEGFTEQQVAEAVAQGCRWAEFDDGHWEIDLDWIEVDILPDGIVKDIDD